MGEITLETLAAELHAHVEGCEKAEKANTKLHRSNTATLKSLAKSQKAMERKLEALDSGLAFLAFVGKYGRWGIGVLAAGSTSALGSILTQNYLLHEATHHEAQAAAQQASAAVTQSQEVAKAVGAPVIAAPKASP
jgi:hypothetical protein